MQKKLDLVEQSSEPNVDSCSLPPMLPSFSNRERTTLAERKERERLLQEGEGNNYAHIRKAAETHRQVRKYARSAIQPGMSMTEIAELIENKVRLLAEDDPENPFAAGMGFPTGLSLNEVAAHYTPNAGDKRSE